MASAGTQSTHKFLSQGQETTSGPALRYQSLASVSLTTNDGDLISPTAGCLFRGLIASVAGQVSIIDVAGNEIPVYLNTGVSNCYQQRWVQTRHGMRLRIVNVCNYIY